MSEAKSRGIVTVQLLLLLLLCCSLWLVESEGDEVGQDRHKFVMEKAVEVHNGLRALHGAVPLIWDNQLEASARKVAQLLIKSRRLASSGLADVGENVAGFKPPQISIAEGETETETEPELKEEEIAFNSIMDWYSEGENFNWTSPDKNWMNGVAHFSQILWNSTRYFGMAVVTEELPLGENNTQIPKSSLAKIIVAHYKPIGNIPGQFAFNVFPKIPYSQQTTERNNENGYAEKSETHTKINKKEKEL